MSSIRKLIVNADDFGRSEDHNQGILACIAVGTVTSTSVLAGFAGVTDAVDLQRRYPQVSLGAHMNLTEGRCLSDPKEVPDLVDANGYFLGKQFAPKLTRGEIPREQLVRELSAQMDRLLSLNLKLTHWDSHWHQHLRPRFFSVAMEVAAKYGIMRMRGHCYHLFARSSGRKARAALHLLTHPHRLVRYAGVRAQMDLARRRGFVMPDRLVSVGVLDDSQKFQRQTWSELFQRLPAGISEIFCHPVRLSLNPPLKSEHFQRETEILSDPSLAQEARRIGVELVSFNELPI